MSVGTTIARRGSRWIGLAAFAALAVFVAVQVAEPERSEEAAAAEVEPAHVEAISGTDRSRVTLTPSAAHRLRVDTSRVVRRTVPINGEIVRRKTVPYSAIVYTEDGATWVYVTARRLTFERVPITIEDIQGDLAVVSSGPEVGTAVATGAVAEIYGSEFGVDH